MARCLYYGGNHKARLNCISCKTSMKLECCVNECHCLLQKQVKYTENKLKALKARNEYLLSLEAANAAVHKYFADDLPDLIDVSS